MIHDTLRSLEGRLDDVRREYTWRGIVRRVERQERRAPRRWWLWLLVPTIAAAAPALLTISSQHDPQHRVTPPVPARHGSDLPSRPSPPDAPVVTSALETPARAPAPPQKPKRRERRTTPLITADERYRRAEAALAARDIPTARVHLGQLLRDHPQHVLVDAARYDLALLAHDAGDDAGALELLDTIVESGSDPAVRSAAEQLRRRLRR